MKKCLAGALISAFILSGCSEKTKIESMGEIFKGTVKEIQITDEQEEHITVIECEDGTLIVNSNSLEVEKDDIVNIQTFNGNTVIDNLIFLTCNGLKINNAIIDASKCNIILNTAKEEKDAFIVKETNKRYYSFRQGNAWHYYTLITFEDENNNTFDFDVPENLYNTYHENSIHYCKYEKNSNTYYIDGQKVNN